MSSFFHSYTGDTSIMEKVLLGSLSVVGITCISFYVWRSKRKNKQNCLHRVEVKIHSAEVGQLIGKTGERLKKIIQKSGAKVKFFYNDDSYDYCVCAIEGSETAVQKAQRIIYSILDQCANMDMSTCFVMDGVDNNSFKLNEAPCTEDGGNRADDLQNSLDTDFVTGHTQKLMLSLNDPEYTPVYVSAVATPDYFWVQSIRAKEHIELDRLTEELREYYESNPQFNVPPRYSSVNVGYICATYSAEDGRWYRAEVSDISPPNESDANETIVDLYFLDYGVSSYQKIKNIRKIPQTFLELKFQAIRCTLSGIKPRDDNWSEEALSFFEDITHVGQWYTLMAQIVTSEDESENGRTLVKLIDTNTGKEINLGNEMIKKGFAV